MLQPAPQSPIRGFFSVNLNVQTTLFQVRHLRGFRSMVPVMVPFIALVMVKSPARVRARRPAAIAKLRLGGVSLQPVEGSIDRKLGARQRRGHSSLPGQSRARFGIRRKRGKPHSE